MLAHLKMTTFLPISVLPFIILVQNILLLKNNDDIGQKSPSKSVASDDGGVTDSSWDKTARERLKLQATI